MKLLSQFTKRKSRSLGGLVALLLFILAPAWALAQDGESSSGGKLYKLGINAAIGYPQIRMENPSGSKVLYDGIAVKADLVIPLIETPSFHVALMPGVKYFDLYNKANNDKQKELANIIGPGVTGELRYKHFVGGVQYHKLWARHFGTGTFSGTVNYQIDTMSLYGGAVKRFGQLSVGAFYSTSTAEIPNSQTGLTRSTPFYEQTYWINAVFTTNQGLFEILGKLF